MREQIEQLDGHLFRVKRDKHGRITSRIACDPVQPGHYLLQNGELQRMAHAQKVIIDVR